MVDIINVIIGITLTILTSFCFNIAVVLQKKGLMQGLPEFKFEGIGDFIDIFKEFFQNKSWITGFILSLLGWIPYMIAQSLIGVLIVSPIMSIGLIFLVLFAKRILDEDVKIKEGLAMGLLIISPILITLSNISEVKINLIEFITPFLIFLLIITSISVFFYMYGESREDKSLEGLFLLLIASALFSLGAIFTNIFVQAFADASTDLSLLTFFEIFFGIFWFIFEGSYAHLWIFIGIYGVGLSNFVGLLFQQNALQKGKAVIMWPIQNGITIIVPVIVGFYVFQQSVNNVPIFIVALILILVAVSFLSKFQAEVEKIEGPQDVEELMENNQGD
ncbi:MAG: hypothetical protein R6U96_06000 [Promethearchaeia archaeon]